MIYAVFGKFSSMQTISEALKLVGAPEEILISIKDKLTAGEYNCDLDLAGGDFQQLNVEAAAFAFSERQKAVVRTAQKAALAEKEAREGGAGASSQQRLQTIEENFAALEEEFVKISLQVKTKNRILISSSSASEIGGGIRTSATMMDAMISVTAADKAEAKAWKDRAGEPLGSQWEAATQAESSLPESDVQGLMSSLLRYQNNDSTLVLVDVHSTHSVCGLFKPDIIGVVKELQIPNTTGLILDLKKQSGEYFTNKNIHQVCQYGLSLLNQLPSSFRHRILVALTDLKKITFVWIILETDGGDPRYEISTPECDVLSALCAVKRMTFHELNVTCPPDVRLDDSDLTPTSYLGSGASATVYSYRTVAPAPRKTYAVKVARDGVGQIKSLQREYSILKELQECPNVPRVSGFSLDHTFLVLDPVGELLTSRLMQELSLSLFKWLPRQLVDTLQFAHKKGFVHRDVRPANIIVHLSSGSDPKAVLIDWAFAWKFDGESDEAYSGTTHHASKRMLTLLGSGGTLRSEAADDLVSLVRTLFSLQHPIMAEELSLVPKNSYGEIEEVWGKWMGGKRKWIAAQNAAAATDYQQVATQLSDLLDV